MRITGKYSTTKWKYLSANIKLLLKKWLSIKIQDIKSIYAHVDLDFTNDNILTSTRTKDLSLTHICKYHLILHQNYT